MKLTKLMLSLVLTFGMGSHVLAAPVVKKPTNPHMCSWNNPGLKPVKPVDLHKLLDHYKMPADVKARIGERMKKLEYDDVVIVRRTGF